MLGSSPISTAAEQRERAVLQLHHHALERLQGRGDLQQPELDRLIRAEQRTARDPEQQAVADLAGGTGDGDLDGCAHTLTLARLMPNWHLEGWCLVICRRCRLSRWVRDQVAGRPGTIWVGIDGKGASGKSTLATRLAAALPGAVIVSADDFARPGASTWELDRFIRQVRDPLLAGRSARYQRWPWDQDTGGEWIEIKPGGTRSSWRVSPQPT